MFKKLLTYGDTFCAVEHSEKTFNILKLKKEKNELKVLNTKQLESLDAVFLNLKKGQHLFLILNNQQVLFKQIEGTFKTKELIVNNAFSTIKLTEFYYQVVSSTPQKHFVAICRKEYVDSIVNQYQSNGVSVIDFSLHNLSIVELAPFFEQEATTTSNAEINFNDDSVESIQKKEVPAKNYHINDLEVSNDFVLPLSGILSYYLKTTNILGNHLEYKNSLKQHYLNKRIFSLGIKGGLSVLFLILLVNFIFFSNLHRKATNLNNVVLAKSNQKNELTSIKNRVDKKAALVNSMYSLSETKTSWIINTIGQSVPNKIQLTKLVFQPIKNTIRENKEIIIANNKIHINGISKSNDLFTNWVAKLELEDWVEKIVVLNYGKGKSSVANFEFEITIKD
ncbi:MAG: hypothetical protein HWD85_00045 [Flavobacteriaceae bacterium]|nr:hypothetical protein [Flavobacteriaceae bacterium]